MQPAHLDARREAGWGPRLARPVRNLTLIRNLTVLRALALLVLATSGAFSSTALSVCASSFDCVLAIFSSRLKVLFRARDFFSSLLFLLRRRLFHLVSPPPPPHAPSSLQFFLRRRLPSSIFPTKS